jgi:hypothetical protein
VLKHVFGWRELDVAEDGLQFVTDLVMGLDVCKIQRRGAGGFKGKLNGIVA